MILSYTLWSESRSRGVDYKMALALLAVENLQRPRWFRWLELKIPGDRSSRTTGVVQQAGASTDRESVDLAIDRYMVPYLPIIDEDEFFERSEWLRSCAKHYNRSSQYVDLVLAAYHIIGESPDFISRFVSEESEK